MKGIIGFEGLKLNCIIGIYPEERTAPQDLIIDLKVQYDVTKCIQAQSMEQALDYVQLAAVSRKIAEKRHFLLEALAHDILDRIFNEFNVNWAWIKIRKPQAIPGAQHAFVELERGDKS